MRNLSKDYNPFEAPQLDDPYPVWRQSRAEEPVFHSEVLDAFVVSRYADIVTILRDRKTYGSVASRKMFAAPCPEADAILDALPRLEETNPLASEPPVHTKLRRYLQPTFMPNKVAILEPELRRIANEMIDGFVDRGAGDFYNLYGYRYPLTVICTLIGLPLEHMDQVKEWASQRVELRNSNLAPDEQIAAARAQKDYYEFTLDLVQQRRADPGEDILSWIIQDSDASDDPLTEDQLASQATSILTAGHETTTYWMTMFMRRLLADRPRWEALVADPSSAPGLVEEALRIDGPVQSIWRLAKEDSVVGGVTIPAGSRISVLLGSANADEDLFPHAREFDTERANVTAHMTFGRGPHTCVGAPIARLEGQISLETLASRLPKLRLAADPGLAFKPSATQRMAQTLNVEWS